MIIHRFVFYEYIDLEVIFLSDFNFDENAMNKLKDMMNNGNISDVISQIPPEMIQNFSLMMQNNSNNNNSNSNSNNNFSKANSSASANSNSKGFDFSNIDMNTILKMKSVMDKMNQNNDPRSNLLHSLKPYLREGKQQKLDQYASLLNVAQIAELFKNNDKENNKNG